MSFEPLETPLGTVPLFVQTPFPAIVRPYVNAERTDFARFGAKRGLGRKRVALCFVCCKSVLTRPLSA